SPAKVSPVGPAPRPAHRFLSRGASARGTVARETDRSGAGDRTHGRPLADVELDLALEAQVSLDHRAGADHDTGLARPARGPAEPATGLLHENAALDARLPAEVDVPANRGQPAAHVGGLESDLSVDVLQATPHIGAADRKSTRLNSSHVAISYAVFCLKK